MAAAGRRLLGVVVDALTATGPPPRRATPLSARLARALLPPAGDRADQAAAAPPTAVVRAVDTALVLLAEHGLAASTVAARVAASTGTDVSGVVAAGLAVLGGPRHGGASRRAHALITAALATGDARGALRPLLARGLDLPGFGHPRYPAGDPRTALLLRRLRPVAGSAPVLRVVRALAREAARAGHGEANVDLALAALSVTTGMHPAAGQVVFAVSRTAGWLAHAVEEYAEEPLRWRGHEHYTGPRPGG